MSCIYLEERHNIWYNAMKKIVVLKFRVERDAKKKKR